MTVAQKVAGSNPVFRPKHSQPGNTAKNAVCRAFFMTFMFPVNRQFVRIILRWISRNSVILVSIQVSVILGEPCFVHFFRFLPKNRLFSNFSSLELGGRQFVDCYMPSVKTVQEMSRHDTVTVVLDI